MDLGPCLEPAGKDRNFPVKKGQLSLWYITGEMGRAEDREAVTHALGRSPNAGRSWCGRPQSRCSSAWQKDKPVVRWILLETQAHCRWVKISLDSGKRNQELKCSHEASNKDPPQGKRRPNTTMNNPKCWLHSNWNRRFPAHCSKLRQSVQLPNPVSPSG